MADADSNTDSVVMQSITDVYSLLRFEEGERLFVYDDYNGQPITKGSQVFGNPTIGVGRSLNIEGITQNESQMLLADDVQKWFALLLPLPWFAALDGVRRAAIVSMTHALGFSGLLQFHHMIAALGADDWQGASDSVLASKWATEAPGRARRCAAMLLSGEWPR